ncbi:MAG: hypothetical protein ABR613_10605 [Actinomycetota bacterium]
MRTLLSIALTTAILILGGFVIYGFGAGYFAAFGVALPTPLNVLGSVILLGALAWAISLLWRRHPN